MAVKTSLAAVSNALSRTGDVSKLLRSAAAAQMGAAKYLPELEGCKETKRAGAAGTRVLTDTLSALQQIQILRGAVVKAAESESYTNVEDKPNAAVYTFDGEQISTADGRAAFKILTGVRSKGDESCLLVEHVLALKTRGLDMGPAGDYTIRKEWLAPKKDDKGEFVRDDDGQKVMEVRWSERTIVKERVGSGWGHRLIKPAEVKVPSYNTDHIQEYQTAVVPEPERMEPANA